MRVVFATLCFTKCTCCALSFMYFNNCRHTFGVWKGLHECFYNFTQRCFSCRKGVRTSTWFPNIGGLFNFKERCINGEWNYIDAET